MTSEDSPSTPDGRADDLAGVLRNRKSVTDITASSDEDGAVVTCYVGVDHADDVEELARAREFDVVHRHEVASQVHYLFGYARD